MSAFPNGRIANEGTEARVQKNAFDIHCQTWIVVYPILRLVMRKSIMVTSRWFQSVVVQHGHRFIDEARGILVELAADPPRALRLIKKSITTVAEEDPKLADFSSSLFRVEHGGASRREAGHRARVGESLLVVDGRSTRRRCASYGHAIVFVRVATTGFARRALKVAVSPRPRSGVVGCTEAMSNMSPST